MKNCIACGMPMNSTADFAMNDESKDYCTYCAKPDGSMRSFDETKEGMTGFMMQTQGIDRETAESAVLSIMEKLPAWEKNFA